MPNMSYCRFQNTAGDLQDCIHAQMEFELPADPDDVAGDAETNDGTNFACLSHSERGAYFELLALAAELLENADPEHLAEAGVNLKRLA